MTRLLRSAVAPAPHGASEKAAWAPTGPIVINVGQDRGALVLAARDDRIGKEVEIERVGDDPWRTHVYVLARMTSDGVVHAAVFPSLPAGRYVIFDLAGQPEQEIEVPPGIVTAATWN